MTSAIYMDQQQVLGQIATATPETRYNNAVQFAQKRVMAGLQRIEIRLAVRELEAVNKLTSLSLKRPGRLARVLSRGKAKKTWDKAMKKQNAAIFNIRKRKSRVHTIRTQASNFQREMNEWIRKRALRVDRDAVLVHDATQEQRRQEAHLKDMEIAKEQEKRRELEQGKENSKNSILERAISAKP